MLVASPRAALLTTPVTHVNALAGSTEGPPGHTIASTRRATAEEVPLAHGPALASGVMPAIRERHLESPEGLLVIPEGEARCAVLVLAGSSGRVDADRARLLARHGAVAMSIRWFGGQVEAATIPVERIDGPVVLAAGGDDR